ncbi:MAG: serine hydrolase domain-containing protein [Planctomycetota bacterium]
MPLLSALFVLTTCQAQDPAPASSEASQDQVAVPTPSSVAKVPTFSAEIDRIVEREMDSNHLPGVAVVIVRQGETIHRRGYGFADLSTQRPVDPDRTLFRIGSVSKALTCLAVTRVVQDGRLGMFDDVSEYFGGIVNKPGFQEPVTVWNLMTHTSGFDQVGGLDRQVQQFELPLEERKRLRPDLGTYLGRGKVRRVSPAGCYFRYDTFATALAGHVLEKVTELPYAEAMRQELFARVGMNDSFVEVGPDRFGDLAVGYGWLGDGYGVAPYEVYATTPASSIDATPADMGRLLEALTGEGKSSRGRLFSSEVTAEVLAPQFRPHPRFSGATHGLWEGAWVGDYGGPAVRTVWHGGTNLGFWTLFSVIPSKGVGVLVVANRDPEAGGDWVTVGGQVMEAVVAEFCRGTGPRPTAEVAPAREVDLAEYAGDYYRGVYCHSCTEEELREGGWPRGASLPVTVEGKALRMEEALYLPTAENDVFVREDGLDEMFFGRDADGKIQFRVSSESPVTRERWDD